MARYLVLGLIALLLWGCDDVAGPTSRASDPDRSYVPEADAKVVARTPVTTYPAAVEVRLFVQDGRDADGRGTYSNRDGRRLTSAERQAIERTFRTDHYGAGARWAAACFVPHHFLRYYDASGDQIGEIQICFFCAGIRADPGVQEQRGPAGTETSELSFDYDALKTAIEALGVRTDIECD